MVFNVGGYRQPPTPLALPPLVFSEIEVGAGSLLSLRTVIQPLDSLCFHQTQRRNDMSKSLLCHCAGIRGFDHVRWDYSGQRKTTEVIRRSSGKFTCPSCGSSSVTATRVGSREILNGKLGADTWVLEVEMHRIRCHDCLAFRMERLPFLSSSLSRISKCLERSIMELRPDMSISAISNYFSVDWRTVKDVEKKN